MPTGLPSSVVFCGSISISTVWPDSNRLAMPACRSLCRTPSSWPRTANSPPEMPTNTLSLITIGADVPVSPFRGSPFFACHTTLPVLASSATSVVSAWFRKIFPSAYERPRLTVSQHITGITLGSCLGLIFPEDFAIVVEIERKDRIWERPVDVHHVADH